MADCQSDCVESIIDVLQEKELVLSDDVVAQAQATAPCSYQPQLNP
jgi:hypothetical protein